VTKHALLRYFMNMVLIGVVSLLAGIPGQSGHVDGLTSSAKFQSPYGIAIDTTGLMFVSDALNHVIRMISSTGWVTTIAGQTALSQTVDGFGTSALFTFPQLVALATNGDLYVGDSSALRLIEMTGMCYPFISVQLGYVWYQVIVPMASIPQHRVWLPALRLPLDTTSLEFRSATTTMSAVKVTIQLLGRHPVQHAHLFRECSGRRLV
jgi:hypothetical protein